MGLFHCHDCIVRLFFECIDPKIDAVSADFADKNSGDRDALLE